MPERVYVRPRLPDCSATISSPDKPTPMGRSRPGIPGAQAAELCSQGQECDLPVHVRRAQQVDTFDYKPTMYALDGKTIPVKTFGRGGKRNEGRVVGPKWKFKQYGQCGKWVSDLFPNLGTCVDDIAFIHSMFADSPIHGSAMLMMNSGRILSGHPCLGSWPRTAWAA